MEFKCGIVGLPNVGRSTLFNTLTEAGIEAADFPFCTIEPNTGVIPTPDPRLDQLAEIIRPRRTPPATTKFVGIVSLVKGASKGKGLDNQFLTNIRETETIGHVAHCFENNNIIHVSGKVNPMDNIKIIGTELALTDPDTYERTVHHVQKKAKGGDKDAKAELTVLEKYLPQLESAGMLRVLDLDAEEKAAVCYLSFLTLEPTMYIVNVNEDGFESNPYLDQVREITAKEGSVVVPVCAAVEADIAELDDGERDKFMREFGLEEPGLNRVIRVGYRLLNLQTYFTAGVKEVRAWTISVDTTTPQAAGKIRTNLEKGFIRAQTISFEDFITHKGEQSAKEAGKVRAEGEDYIVKDGDVMNSLFNV